VKTPVDMSPEAIAGRIRELSRLSRLDDPFRPRVDMSAEAIAARIHELSELSRLCGSLAQAGADAELLPTSSPP
jgi:hypothetical protein